MPKGLLLLLIVVGLISAQPLDSQEIPFAGSGYARSFLRTIYGGLERFTALWCPSGISFLADGGGSDGGSDGGGRDSTGEGTGNGAGDAASADGVASAGDDAAAGDDATASADNSEPGADPTSVTVAPTTPTDPTTEQNAVTPEIAAIEAIATTDPRGGFAPSDVPGPAAGSAIVSGAPGAPVDIAINAVIVSAAQSPWDAITKSLGVRNVIVTGGIIALGKTPIEGEIPGGGPQPAWLRLVPDLRLLNGSMIPPVVPNVIDIRILKNSIEILNPRQGG
jgi:hypothetical protein